jgi:hypothetical protein
MGHFASRDCEDIDLGEVRVPATFDYELRAAATGPNGGVRGSAETRRHHSPHDPRSIAPTEHEHATGLKHTQLGEQHMTGAPQVHGMSRSRRTAFDGWNDRDMLERLSEGGERVQVSVSCERDPLDFEPNRSEGGRFTPTCRPYARGQGVVRGEAGSAKAGRARKVVPMPSQGIRQNDESTTFVFWTDERGGQLTGHGPIGRCSVCRPAPSSFRTSPG